MNIAMMQEEMNVLIEKDRKNNSVSEEDRIKIRSGMLRQISRPSLKQTYPKAIKYYNAPFWYGLGDRSFAIELLELVISAYGTLGEDAVRDWKDVLRKLQTKN